MVGAKQFAIRRKVATEPRVNPLLAAISMPAFMKANDAELRKPNAFAQKKPNLPFSITKLIQSKQPSKHVSNTSTRETVTNKNDVISDELADLITYKVLKNIKSYLNPQSQTESSGRHIKLEISL